MIETSLIILSILSLTISLIAIRIKRRSKLIVETGNRNRQEDKVVNIEELLNRSIIKREVSHFVKGYQNETILITGAGGSIGSELTKQILDYEVKKVILLDQSESALYNLHWELKRKDKLNFETVLADICDKVRIDHIFQEYRPTIVFHAAGNKAIPLVENAPYEAIKTNVEGTKILADASSHYNAKKFVFLSTDKAAIPVNVVGVTKRIAEQYINSLNSLGKTKYITTRFGNVIGPRGSIVPILKMQLERGGPLMITHKQVSRFFMTESEVSNLILEASLMGNGGEIFVFDMGESVRIYDLAKNMIRLAGYRYPEDIDIKIVGLRPGEKLYEELLASGENTLPTYHEKIMLAKNRKFDYAKVKMKIDELCVSNKFLNMNVIEKMKELVPEYISNNTHEYKDALLPDESIDEYMEKLNNLFYKEG
ncbi:polysaccharide biosynthesis protein [Flagellimonas crocea]|uniref:polysaccharide biosynthesis protein n=1 Tax=Flagellimonas crocea TaxID=3067311 RepID=UPI00296FE491|nr:polysaccharide biosynthesis protein [Muricauda sp. DH64]